MLACAKHVKQKLKKIEIYVVPHDFTPIIYVKIYLLFM